MKTNEFEIREPRPSDLNFIQSTFHKSIKSESTLGRACSNRVFFSEFPQVVDHILDRSKVLIACSLENSDAILCYLIYEPQGLIHFVYTKQDMREFNLAKDLIAHAFPSHKSLQFSLSTNDAKKITKKYPEFVFNPFHLFKKGIA